MNILREFKIELVNDEVVRLLRSKKGNEKKKSIKLDLLEEINELKNQALDFIHPVAIYDRFESEKLEPKFLFSRSEITIFAVCTIGEELEKESLRMIKKEKLGKGIILDAIASHAAEQTAEYVNQMILKNLQEELEEKEYTCRFSPGYCQWELESGQKLIFRLLPANQINVQLTESCMMVPRKSVSFALNIGKNVDKGLGVRECNTCEFIRCAYRRT